jgi:DNA polymerase-4
MYGINPEKPLIMHIDLNSAFASAEQQAHPTLRGKPMGVTNRLSKECVVIAASYEAKALGIKVGTRRSEALAICSEFVFIESDPAKYHAVYEKLIKIMKDYSPKVKMKSIDEGIIDFHGMEPVLKGRTLEDIGYEIKRRVKSDIGDWMRINIGIGTNYFLAKEAASWHKPDGLDKIDHTNLLAYYRQRQLTDLSGIAEKYQARLNSYGIMTPMDFLKADENMLQKRVFKGITGLYWYKRLRGYEIDDYDTKLGMVGRQWVVHNPTDSNDYLLPCLSFLCETTGMKLRFRQAEARGICVWARYKSGEHWYAKRMHKVTFYTNQEIYQYALQLFNSRPRGTIIMIGIYCYMLTPSTRNQMSLFEDIIKKDWLTKAVDEINDFYGKFTVYSATSLNGRKIVKQKVPFGGTDYFNLLINRS